MKLADGFWLLPNFTRNTFLPLYVEILFIIFNTYNIYRYYLVTYYSGISNGILVATSKHSYVYI